MIPGILATSAICALTLVGGASRASASEEAPTPGSWRKLAVRTFDLPDDADIDTTLKDLPRLLRHFHPQGVKVTNLSVENEGPRKLPRVTFKATMHVDVEVGPVHVEKDEEVWVRADVTARAGRCAYDPSRLGFEVKLDLSASDEPVSANVQTMVAALCVDPQRETGESQSTSGSGFRRRAELTSFMQVGPDYGTRVAGRLATNMLVKQTEPILAAVQGSLLTTAGAAVPYEASAPIAPAAPAIPAASPKSPAPGTPAVLPRRLGSSPQPVAAGSPSVRKASELVRPHKEL